MKNKLFPFEFNDQKLLNVALTHSSYTADNGGDNYERLEYLGDAILGEIVAEYLYNNFQNLSAGELTKYRAKLVNANVLGDIVVQLGIDKYVRTGASIKKVSHNIYADVYESLLAAIYLDGGNANKFVYDTLLKSKDNVLQVVKANDDYKTRLQELLAKQQLSFKYKLVEKIGDGIDAQFAVQLFVDNKCVAKACASSIKHAEQLCAKSYINNI